MNDQVLKSYAATSRFELGDRARGAVSVATDAVLDVVGVLAAHPGPDFGDAAAGVLLGRDAAGTRLQLEQLADAGWLQPTAEGRYKVTDRGTATRRNDSRVVEALCRVLCWYLDAAAGARSAIVPRGPRRPVSLPPLDPRVEAMRFAGAAQAVAWYRREREVLLAAIEAAFVAGVDEVAWKLPVVLDNVRTRHDSPERWMPALKTALRAARRSGVAFAEAVVVEQIAGTCRLTGCWSDAVAWYRQAQALFGMHVDAPGRVRVLNGLGLTYASQRRWTQAATCYRQALDLTGRTDEQSLYAALIALNLGTVLVELGEGDRAEQVLSEAIAEVHRAGASVYEAEGLVLRAEVSRRGGQFAEARADIDRALGLRGQIGDSALDGLLFLGLGRLQRDEDQPMAARESFEVAAAQSARYGRADWAAEAQAEVGELPAARS